MESPHGGSYRLHGHKLYRVNLRERYDLMESIGNGSFGTVYLARRKGQGTNNNLVAIKSMRNPITPGEECLKLREVQSLCAIPEHPSIVPILEAFYDPTTQLFHMVMEHMQENLYQLMKSRNGHRFRLEVVRSILFQILSALDHCHRHNYFHRDIKPENILVTQVRHSNKPHSGLSFIGNSRFMTPPTTPVQYVVKLADFGLAREVNSRPPFTAYVSTRWYRAPEVLLRAERYSAPVDMWAFGTMAVELATLNPLFPGSDELDQVWRICDIMGSPGDWRDAEHRPVGGGSWPDGPLLAYASGFSFPEVAPKTISSILGKHWPASLSNLVEQTLYWNPDPRTTSTAALQHTFFREAGLSPPATSIGLPRVERLSLLPWLDSTQETVRSDQVGIKRTVYDPRPDSPVSKSDARHISDMESMSIKSGQPSISNRQSWFSRTRNNIIGRSIFDHGGNRTSDRPADIYSGSLRSGNKVEAPPLDNGSDLTTSVHMRHHFEARRPQEEHNGSHQYGLQTHGRATLKDAATSDVDAISRQFDSNAWNSKVPIPTISKQPTGPHRMTRTISNVSSERRAHHASPFAHLQAESNSGIGGLLSHLRKKHKKTEDYVTKGNAAQANLATCTQLTHDASLRSPLQSPHDQASLHKSKYVRPPGLQASTVAAAPSASRSTSKSPIRRQDAPAKGVDPRSTRESSSLIARSPHEKGKGSRRISLHATHCPAAAHAVTPIAETTRPMPSYAKSTAASQRRASNFHMSTGQLQTPTASRKSTSSRSPAIPMNSFQRSLF